MSIIQVENLTKKFNNFTAVDAISFAVEPGEVFGFLGPNGAGKTTTINILCTLLKPTTGKAIVSGHDTAHDANQVRKQIGIIFQDPSLDDRLTAEDNLKFHGYLYNMDHSMIENRIKDVLTL